MACIMKNKLDNGKISYTIQVKAKDPKTNKYKFRNMTWRKPPDMTEYEAKREVDKIAYEFENKFRKQILGQLSDDEGKTFEEYSAEWLIRIKKNKSIHYYQRAGAVIKVMNKYFGKLKLVDITPNIIQKFIDKLQEHEVVQEYAVLKKDKDIRTYLKINRIKPKDLKKITGVADHTYQASQRGEHIRVDNAKKLCKGLNLDFNEYYEIVKTTHLYARESVLKYKRCLSAILASAKRQRLVEHNFASSDYILPISGTKKEIEILNDEDVKKFKEELDKETNPRWKIAMYIILFMGLRRGELAGLEWKDIDFEKKTMSIERSSYAVSKVGLITKDPKTFTSKRCLTIPDSLVQELKKYKEWYMKRKSLLGDLWDNTDRLLINDEGELIRPATYRLWLKKILKRAGLKEVTLHSIRHTNITLQISSGVDLKTVSVRAGHARASTTSDIYSHFIRSSDTHASKVLDNIFANNDKVNAKDDKIDENVS